MLYHFPNTTESQGAAAETYVASRLVTLIAVKGTMAAPAQNIHIRSLALAHAAPTFMSAYEVPSAGKFVASLSFFHTAYPNLQVSDPCEVHITVSSRGLNLQETGASTGVGPFTLRGLKTSPSALVSSIRLVVMALLYLVMLDQ